MTSILWKRGRIALIAVVAALSMVLSACGGSGGSGGDGEPADDVVIALSYKASTLDPHNGGNYDYQYTAPAFDALVGWDEDGSPAPALAESWELADDALSLTFQLREGVQFQDGAALDAEAVKKSLDRARAKENGTAGDLAVVQDVVVVDPLTVQLTFSAPGAHMINALGDDAGKIVSPNVVDGEVGTNPVGAGPFKVVSQSPDEVVYEAWDGYWDADNVKPQKLTIRAIVDDGARVRALNSGEIDAGNMRPANIAEIEAGGNKVVSGPSDLIYYMVLNTSRPGLDDPDVRKALLNAVDRETINESLYDGLCEPIVQPYIEELAPHVPEMQTEEALAYKPEEAQAALEAAGFGPSNPLTVALKPPNITVYQELSEVIQDQFAKIGINATVTPVETAQASPDIRQGNFDIYVGPNNVAAPDASTFLYNWYLRPTAPWLTNFQVPGAEELLNEARSTADPAEQAKPLQELVKAIYEQGAPAIPVCAPMAVAGVVSGMEGFVSPVEGAYNWKPVVVSR